MLSTMVKIISHKKMLLIDAKVSMICKAFANGATANIKFLISENQMPKMVQFSTAAPFIHCLIYLEENLFTLITLGFLSVAFSGRGSVWSPPPTSYFKKN